MKKIVYTFFLYFPFYIVLTVAIFQRLQIPFVPYSIMDGYYTATVKYFQGIGIYCGNRLPPYPLFIFISTLFTNSFSTIAYFQVTLGILTSVFLVKTFKKISYSPDKSNKIISYLLSLILFTVYILSSSKIDLEYSLRPEVFSQYFSVALMYLFYMVSKNEKKVSNNLKMFVFLGIFSAYFQDKFVGIAVLNILLALYFIYRQKHNHFKLIFQHIFVPVFVFLIITNFFHIITNIGVKSNPDFDRKMWGYSSLFLRNQDLIMKIMNQDYLNPDFNKYPKDILKRYLDFYETTKSYYPEKGLIKMKDLDNINYKLSADFNRNMYKYMSAPEILNLKKHYIYQSIIRYPTVYLYKYIVQIKEVYTPFSSQIFLPNQDIFYGYRYQEVKTNFSTDRINLDRNVRFIDHYYDQIKDIPGNASAKLSSPILNAWYYRFNFLYTPVLFMFLALALINTKSPKYKVIKSAALYSTLSAFLMVSYTCFVYINLDRYLAEVFPLFLISFILMIYYLTLNFKEAFLHAE